MNDEYERIANNVKLVEDYCDNLDDKMVKFQEGTKANLEGLREIDGEGDELGIAEIKEKLEEDKERRERMMTMQTIHSDSQRCIICGKGHDHHHHHHTDGDGSPGENTLREMNSTMNNTDPNKTQDMTKKKKKKPKQQGVD